MLENSPLGKKTFYNSTYDKTLLFAIPRLKNQSKLISEGHKVDYYGIDIWNHYELSWLDLKGKPKIGIGIISYNAASPNLIESKSMKLYFNSFNNTKLKDNDEFKQIVIEDLSQAIGTPVTFDILSVNTQQNLETFTGTCLDGLDIECNIYDTDANLLKCNAYKEEVTEHLYSNLLKSNCLMTNQPDWGSVFIQYQGSQINHESLLKYIVSFRNHNGFHEQCVEQIFTDIKQICKPSKLTVYARYTRRGGLDINPFRTTEKDFVIPDNLRLIRQ